MKEVPGEPREVGPRAGSAGGPPVRQQLPFLRTLLLAPGGREEGSFPQRKHSSAVENETGQSGDW